MYIKLAFPILSFRPSLNSDGEVISESDQWYFYMLITHNFHLDYDASLLGWNDNMLPVGSSYGRIYTGEELVI